MNGAARLEAFLEMMSAERGASANTLDAYRRDIEDASAFIGGGLAAASTAALALLNRPILPPSLAIT